MCQSPRRRQRRPKSRHRCVVARPGYQQPRRFFPPSRSPALSRSLAAPSPCPPPSPSAPLPSPSAFRSRQRPPSLDGAGPPPLSRPSPRPGRGLSRRAGRRHGAANAPSRRGRTPSQSSGASAELGEKGPRGTECAGRDAKCRKLDGRRSHRTSRIRWHRCRPLRPGNEGGRHGARRGAGGGQGAQSHPHFQACAPTRKP